MNFSWVSTVWNKLTSPSALKTEAKILGIAAAVSTNPEVSAEIEIGAKVVNAIAESTTTEKVI
jgi:hypothetical protein